MVCFHEFAEKQTEGDVETNGFSAKRDLGLLLKGDKGGKKGGAGSPFNFSIKSMLYQKRGTPIFHSLPLYFRRLSNDFNGLAEIGEKNWLKRGIAGQKGEVGKRDL